MVPATAVEPSVIAHVEVARVVSGSIAVMRNLMTMLVRAIRALRQVEDSIVDCCLLARTHRLNGAPVRT